MLDYAINKKIITKCTLLKKYGINDLAWNKEDARVLINSIMKDKIGIIGGDVYDLTSGFKPLCDNWLCEPINFELEEEYYIRSKLKALNYIDNFPVLSEEKIVFSMTFTEDIYIGG